MATAITYEGKAKILTPTAEAGIFQVFFKDDATAFNAQKRGQIRGKGEINCTISSHLLQFLQNQGIPTHFRRQIAPNVMEVQALTMFALEVVVRNQAAGSLCRETGIPLGQELTPPLVEFYYKNDRLGDPLLTPDRLRLLNLATPEQVQTLVDLAQRVNGQLRCFFAECGILLIDFKLEFGWDDHGQVILADEISPDTCRLWLAQETDPVRRVVDKDRFRHDLGEVESAYQLVLERVLRQ
ncbi:phosphoribosylaminoimidazole-succinocarboxamide synthase [Gloeomargarita lithophora Alchichica-D10]|uniref:Phosphoribosylaminoimidazole-succinocarboxamide synthase n=1 Tax=Gloeomargarita lithophora Alchichica-D10 TaxID=1188229 RepID=A0A1J0ACY3_9CYAN|nr:phosphoribosylaminoimidazolesuccinocarboxamide synthase [Gloeomargarita lithophora]APB33796.1 phosphoribosylaminoimidazole-succinocarboxamide synthase [Gloeomargarita lithophora Alchichica-D10]